MSKNYLIEVSLLKNFIQSIGLSFQHADVDDKTKKAQEKIAGEIFRYLVDTKGVKEGAIHQQRDEDTFVKKVNVTINGEKYVLKASLIYGHANLSVTLWDDKESGLLDVIIIGDLKDKYKLKSLGRSRLLKWGKE